MSGLLFDQIYKKNQIMYSHHNSHACWIQRWLLQRRRWSMNDGGWYHRVQFTVIIQIQKNKKKKCYSLMFFNRVFIYFLYFIFRYIFNDFTRFKKEKKIVTSNWKAKEFLVCYVTRCGRLRCAHFYIHWNTIIYWIRWRLIDCF